MDIIIPIVILTRKISKNKTNSLFYASRNIAKVKVNKREYVLTTSGSYDFSLKENGAFYTYEPGDIPRKSFIGVRKNLTDSKIKILDDRGLIKNWGWFGINVWEGNKFVHSDASETYGTYDEALRYFKEFIEKNL